MQLQRDSSLLSKLRALWTCPISHSVIAHPVITTAGHTYERKALEDWLKSNTKDHQCGIQLIHREPITNIALKNVIDLLESELPNLESELIESRSTIRELEQKLSSIRQIIEQKTEIDEDSEELFQNRTERETKTKKIRKQGSKQKDIENPRLSSFVAENQNYRQLIQDLRIKQKQNEKSILDLKAQLASEIQERSYLQQDKAILENDSNLFKTMGQSQKKAFDQLITFTNNRFKASYKYYEKFLKSIEAEFKKVVQGQNLKNLAEIDIIGLASESMIKYLKNDRNFTYNHLKNRDPSKARRQCQLIEDLIEFGRGERLMRTKFKQNILMMTLLYDNMHLSVRWGLQLRRIPFSYPATQEELQINWSKVIKINTGFWYSVDQNTWNEFIKNIEKFPSLSQLEIEICNVPEITLADLEKLKKLEKIVLKNGQFSEETVKNLTEFMEKHSWIDMTVKKV